MKRRASARVTQKAKTAKKEEGVQFDASWSLVGTALSKGLKPLLVLDGDGIPPSSIVYGFDMDNTIIKTASGRTFGIGPNDWLFLYPDIPDRLRQLHDSGIKVVFFTNQGGIEKGKVTIEGACQKIDNVIKAIGCPIQAFASTGESHFRKPSSCVWDYMEKNCNGGKTVDRSKCYYVGDAAGRQKEWQPGKKKDFSCSDRMFASNAKVQFATPEEFFLKEEPAPFQWGSIDPTSLLNNVVKANQRPSYASNKTEMIILVGRPAAGKSTFAERYLKTHGYVVVNRDTLQTQAKCLDMAKKSLTEGKSVVVDNTNPGRAVRQPYIEAAKKVGVPVRCFYLTTPMDVASHLNLFRQTQSKGTRRRIPEVGFRVFNKSFESPTKAEGFTEIITLDFQPSFDSSAAQTTFTQWTC